METYLNLLQLLFFKLFEIMLVSICFLWFCNLTCMISILIPCYSKIHSKLNIHPKIMCNTILETSFRDLHYLFIYCCQILLFRCLNYCITTMISAWFLFSSPYFIFFWTCYFSVFYEFYHSGKVLKLSTTFVFYTFSFEFIFIE